MRKYIPVAFFKYGGYKLGIITRNAEQVLALENALPSNGDPVKFIPSLPSYVKSIRWLVLERN